MEDHTHCLMKIPQILELQLMDQEIKVMQQEKRVTWHIMRYFILKPSIKSHLIHNNYSNRFAKALMKKIPNGKLYNQIQIYLVHMQFMAINGLVMMMKVLSERRQSLLLIRNSVELCFGQLTTMISEVFVVASLIR